MTVKIDPAVIAAVRASLNAMSTDAQQASSGIGCYATNFVAEEVQGVLRDTCTDWGAHLMATAQCHDAISQALREQVLAHQTLDDTAMEPR